MVDCIGNEMTHLWKSVAGRVIFVAIFILQDTCVQKNMVILLNIDGCECYSVRLGGMQC